jgi:NAD(P)H-dependent flavin oxidoreductase YrpB (nitropropane dioxygenase family)
MTISMTARLPRVIQGGMGVAISSWQLARVVSQLGQLGVVSGTGLDTVLVRRLQDGDPGGHLRRALAHFPFQKWVQPVLKRYFKPEGRAKGQGYLRLPMPTGLADSASQVLHTLACFCEVFLAKEGHPGLVGINLLTKIQIPNIPSLYGAMLAGADYVLMGAGIPREIPEVLDRLSEGQSASIKLEVTNAEGAFNWSFDPAQITEGPIQAKRPAFLPIIASNSLATMLARKVKGSIQGFVVEGPTAGGHNAPPRGTVTYDEIGQPIYGERDKVDLEQLATLGLPFWLAGGTGSPEGLEQALEQGAAGIQVGTLFAYSQESGFTAELKEKVLQAVLAGEASIYTDAKASPTGFPFKVAQMPGTLSEEEVYGARKRVCDMGYLREIYQKEGGKLGFRCASEPLEAYQAKGGDLANTVGRKCLCNALMASTGIPQIQKDGSTELPLITSGDELSRMAPFLARYSTRYSARQVLEYLLGKKAGKVGVGKEIEAGG